MAGDNQSVPRVPPKTRLVSYLELHDIAILLVYRKFQMLGSGDTVSDNCSLIAPRDNRPEKAVGAVGRLPLVDVGSPFNVYALRSDGERHIPSGQHLR